MTKTTEPDLQTLRLPELRARYAELFGEETRCPNKTWLIRKISAATATPAEGANADAEQATVTEPEPQPQPQEVAHQPEATEPAPAPPKLTKMTVEALQALYADVVGRPTGSQHPGYLRWKIRQAQKGKIPVGPRPSRTADGEPLEYKVLPLRMEANLVQQLDEARERLGLGSRMELFRRALAAYLAEAGEDEVAARFTSEA